MSAKDDSASPAVEAGLDDRKAAILRAIVEQYVASAQPVGSPTVTRTADLGVSAATVRNEMSLLEREGYIAQPHTSAGRVPTDRGYRYYVDHLAGVDHARRARAAPHRRVLHHRDDGDGRAAARRRASCSPASPRTPPSSSGRSREAVVVRGAHLVLLQPRVLLAVVILSNGAVEKQVVYLDDDVSEADVAAASARLAPACSTATGSRDLAGARRRRAPATTRRRPARARVARRACAPTSACTTREPLYVGGASRLAAEQEAFSGTTRRPAHRAARAARRAVVADARAARARPHGAHRLRERDAPTCRSARSCSRRTSSKGELLGTVGVLGPTRMDYRKAQAAVATVSQRLGRQLSQ